MDPRTGIDLFITVQIQNTVYMIWTVLDVSIPIRGFKGIMSKLLKLTNCLHGNAKWIKGLKILIRPDTIFNSHDRIRTQGSFSKSCLNSYALIQIFLPFIYLALPWKQLVSIGGFDVIPVDPLTGIDLSNTVQITNLIDSEFDTCYGIPQYPYPTMSTLVERIHSKILSWSGFFL